MRSGEDSSVARIRKFVRQGQRIAQNNLRMQSVVECWDARDDYGVLRVRLVSCDVGGCYSKVGSSSRPLEARK